MSYQAISKETAGPSFGAIKDLVRDNKMPGRAVLTHAPTGTDGDAVYCAPQRPRRQRARFLRQGSNGCFSIFPGGRTPILCLVIVGVSLQCSTNQTFHPPRAYVIEPAPDNQAESAQTRHCASARWVSQIRPSCPRCSSYEHLAYSVMAKGKSEEEIEKDVARFLTP